MALINSLVALSLFAIMINASPSANATGSCALISNIYSKCMTGACPDQGRNSSLGQSVSFPAHLADECLRSLPFNKTAAKLQLREVTNFLQVYSAQAFWKQPPKIQLGIEAVDLNATLDSIQLNIENNQYSGTYQFDLAVTDALNSFHDGHTGYSTPCSIAFLFVHDHPLVSVSESPDRDPAIYLGDVVTNGPVNGGKVSKINGQVPEVYLKELAESQPYYIDRASRYSALFLRKIIPQTAISQTDHLGLFAARGRLPSGPLKITLADGTSIDVEWRAEYNWFLQLSRYSNFGPPRKLPFKSSLDLQESCVNPAFGHSDGFNKRRGLGRAVAPRQSKKTTPPRLPVSYPPAIDKLAYNEVSYFGLDGNYGVIKLASFLQWPFTPFKSGSENTFPQEVYNLISKTLRYFRAHDYEKVIIDVSRNNGGDINAGFAAFQAFFPSARPYYGRDLRISPLLEASSRALLNESFRLSTLEQAAEYRTYTDVTGRNYPSARQFLGPIKKNSDYFTELSRQSVSARFEEAGTIGAPKNVSFAGAAPFAAANIILLSDSHCVSSCSVFAEALREVGVRSVAYGGPASSKGKMQVSGGTKGAERLDYQPQLFNNLDSLEESGGLKASYVPQEPPYSMTLSANLINAYRKGEDKIPLEFQRIPATNTMQLTAKMMVSIEERWRVAAQRIWGHNATSPGE